MVYVLDEPATDESKQSDAMASSAEPNHILRVSADVAAANLDHLVEPIYPKDAADERIKGTVTLEATIGKDGSVKNLRYVSGPQMLAPAAMDAVRQWHYKPTTLDGRPAEVSTTINVIFAPDREGRLKPQPRG